jgi:hypothetical protein
MASIVLSQQVDFYHFVIAAGVFLFRRLAALANPLVAQYYYAHLANATG